MARLTAKCSADPQRPWGVDCPVHGWTDSQGKNLSDCPTSLPQPRRSARGLKSSAETPAITQAPHLFSPHQLNPLAPAGYVFGSPGPVTSMRVPGLGSDKPGCRPPLSETLQENGRTWVFISHRTGAPLSVTSEAGCSPFVTISVLLNSDVNQSCILQCIYFSTSISFSRI